MTLPTIEIAVFHPEEVNRDEAILFQHRITEDQIGVTMTVEIPTGGSAVQDKRPLMMALRRVEGDTSDLRYSMFTLTFSKIGDTSSVDTMPTVADTDNGYTTTVVADVNTYIGGDNDWHGMYIGHVEAMELSRLHITWGPAPIPVPSS